MTRTIMLQGTGSDVGKTVLVAGLCRIAANRGLKVRPFKPQNMSNNAAVSADGGEIGRAQWLQALAARVASSVHMNPVLLKPQSDTGSQIVVQGKVFGQVKGRDYQALKPRLMGAVLESFETVSAGADLVVVEGAGSPAEINLRAGDIANMGFATRANVPVVLVGDIDRGGVIASLVGTHTILPEEDPEIGRFTGWPCFGVVPWLRQAARLPAEDSVVLERLAGGGGGALKVAVPVLPRIANFDDLDPLGAEPQVDLVFIRPGERLPADAGLVVLPGSKSTIADLHDFRAAGWEQDLAMHMRRGGRVIGICGGYQMPGRQVTDPLGLEGSTRAVAGLGLLDVETEMAPEKTVRNSTARSLQYDVPLDGYEIHLGRTAGPDALRPAVSIDGRPDGALSPDGRVMGTYLHGLLSSDAYRARLLADFGIEGGGFDYRAGVDEALDGVAAELEAVLDRRWLDGLLRTAD